MALYHTHRPQKFDDLVGQEHIKQTITNQIKHDRTAHAYLFSGPRGVGKTTTARLIAKALNCMNRKEKTTEPCNTCSSCEEISKSRSIDVIEIDAASHTGVDNVRENIIENSRFKPTSSPFKIFIIDEVHMLSTSAFNALLKTLEEPPNHVMFILATTEPHKLPETIISRCQRFGFKKVAYSELKEYLEKIAKLEKTEIDSKVIDRLINKSDGCVRDAISLLDQIMATGSKKITEDLASAVLPASNVEDVLLMTEHLLNKNTSDALQIISKLETDGISFTQFSLELLEMMRNLMILSVTGGGNIPGVDLSNEALSKLEDLSKTITANEIIKLIDETMLRRDQIKMSPIPQLPLEILVLSWCHEDNQEISRNADPSPVEPITENIDLPTENETTNNEPPKPEISKTKKIKEKVKSIVTKGDPIELSQVESKWQDILSHVEKTSPSLVFILKMCNLVSADGNTVTISVGFKFHQDKLEDNKSKKHLEQILSDSLDTKIRLKVTLTDAAQQVKQDNELNELATAFGGDVVK